MKSFAHFVGSLALFIGIAAKAQYVPEVIEPYGDQQTSKSQKHESHYLLASAVALGTVGAFYEISRLQQGAIVFAALDSMVAVYLLREVYGQKDEFDKLTVPLSLVTLAIVNAALLENSDRFTSHEVFLYNTIGTGLIAAYAYWDYTTDPKNPWRRAGIMPFINESHTGFAWTLRY